MVAFLLSISYASSIGGNGTLVGGAPNIVFKGYFENHYKDGGLNFVTFLAFGFPFTVLMTFFTWIVLCLLWLPTKDLCFSSKRRPNNSLKLVMIKQYNDLGPYK
jgi:sodium-dependent dicarboxylate transporter 2/3/5